MRKRGQTPESHRARKGTDPCVALLERHGEGAAEERCAGAEEGDVVAEAARVDRAQGAAEHEGGENHELDGRDLHADDAVERRAPRGDPQRPEEARGEDRRRDVPGVHRRTSSWTTTRPPSASPTTRFGATEPDSTAQIRAPRASGVSASSIGS